jgi:cell division septation protein DedD
VRGTTRVAAVALLVAIAFGSPVARAQAASTWTGGVDLYRSGVFTRQGSWLWCTAADVQIIRNIVGHHTDHARLSQQHYFEYMRAHDRYRIPLKDGVDPAGWTAGLRHYVDARYALVASTSFDAALRSAVTNLRKTNLPVGITVSHGNHAWVLTGFTATADPAATADFAVTSVRVVGPLYGLQSRTYGYDMRPDTKLTPRQLRGFFTPWHYTSVPMAWENRWVSVQPIALPTTGSTPPPAPTATATPAPTRTPAATPNPTPNPTAVAIAVATPIPSNTATSETAASGAASFVIVLGIAVALALAVFALGLRTGRPAPR